MTESPALSRPVKVDDIPGGQTDVTVEASAEEREALAREYGLAGIDRLIGRFLVVRKGRFVHVTGDVEAAVAQVCVVSLDPFTAQIREKVDLRFTEPQFIVDHPDGSDETEVDLDAPDPIDNGRIDLGALTGEILSLALDPYPRKPGVAFDFPQEPDEPSPFSVLGKLKDAPPE